LSRFVGWNNLLNSARRIVSSGAIQVVKRSAARLPHSAEAMALTISALGALDRHTGVHIINLDLDGEPVALAIIQNATFEQDDQGVTELVQIEQRKPS
jgi:hypothetical protein